MIRARTLESSSDDYRVTDDRRVVKGGVVSGLVAGGLLTAMMTIMSAARGTDIWFGIKGAAAPFLGQVAMQPGFDPIAVPLGLVLHLLVSVAWALTFASLFYGLSKKATVAAGVGWGIVVWLGMYYVVLPFVGLASMREGAPISRVVAYHSFFGVLVAVAFLPYQRKLPAHAGGRLQAV